MSFLVSLLVVTARALAQGYVNFSNYAPPDLNAPMIYADPDHGFEYRLDGRCLAQLYAGDDDAGWSLAPVGTAVAFRNGQGAGYFTGGVVTIPFLAPQNGGYFQVRMWAASGGPTYETAVASGQPFGTSNVFHLAVLGGPLPGLPVDLVGLQSSGIFLISEPSPLALAVVGVAALGWGRRR